MAPIRFKDLAEERDRYNYVILNDISERLSLRITPLDFDGTDLVDEDGYLIPGAVLTGDGIDIGPVEESGQVARGVVLEAVKIADSNSTEDLTSAQPLDVVIVVAGTVEQGLAEDNLGREYTEDELEAFNLNDALILTLTPSEPSDNGDGGGG